jgi:predicted transcriptional regulator
MVFELSQLNKIRKQLNFTQKAFAKEAGISQSMVAKIESGKLDPTYSKVKQIEETISRLMKKDEKQAKEIMTMKIHDISPSRKVDFIIKLMRNHDISQVPVMENENVIGLVSEKSILSKNLDEIQKATARDVMVESPPIISPSTNMEIMRQLLNHYSLLLVKEKGKLVGLITRSDLMAGLA